MPVSVLAIVVFAALWLCGCSAESPAPDYAATETQANDELPSSATLEAASLPRGDYEIQIRDGSLELLANDAPLDTILADLAERLGFELELAPGERPLVFVALSGQDLPDALATLLAGLDYEAGWGGAEARELRWLSVAAAISIERAPQAEQPPSEVAEPIREARRRFREASPEEEEQQRVSAQLRDPDPDVRVGALEVAELEGEVLRQLIVMARNDEDPEVRARVVEQLEDADGYAAVATLVDALGDPDERVVLAAIEALSFSGDESVIPELERLREHRDIEVRESAEEAIELLE